MTITSRVGMLAALLSLSALSAPAAQASSSSEPTPGGQYTVEARHSRIAAAVRQQHPAGAGEPELLAAGFVNGR